MKFYLTSSKLVLLILAFACHSFAQQRKLVTIPDSEHRLVHSKLAGNDYDIYIHYPAGYDTTKQKLPVLYVVDGDNDFSPTLEYLGLLKAEFHITEPILVAIGDGGLIGSPGNHRNRDFSPLKVETSAESGGAPKFLAFIARELIPSIDSTLKTDPNNRTLYGYSMGGLFASYTLFSGPELFRNILIGSPALSFDSGSIFELEKSYSEKNKKLNTHVFLEVGGLETPRQILPAKKLADILDKRHYKNLVYKYIVLETVTHLSGKPVTMQKALQWAYTH